MLLQDLSREDQTVNTVDVLSEGMERLKEEHEQLKASMQQFYEQAKKIGTVEEVTDWSRPLAELYDTVKGFMLNMDLHSAWEDEVLFPLVADYTGKDMGPIAVMEAEHQLAKQNVLRFQESLGQMKGSVSGPEAKEAASFLLQAYVILSDHLKREEEFLFPLAEQMLEDIEQFFAW